MPNRNAESYFSTIPTIDISRSRFDRGHEHKTSFNFGDLVPFEVDEVLPGDSFDITTSKVVRLQSLITPVMDNMYLDMYYFFVPSRLVWSHWKEFMGENTHAPWYPTTTYIVPKLVAPSGGWQIGTIADYFGIPTGVDNLEVNALPFRAYALIASEWFRSEELTYPAQIHLDDTKRNGSNGSIDVTDMELGGMPFKAAKFHDYFTSCTRAPQSGPSVTIPLGTDAPVFAGKDNKLSRVRTGNPLNWASRYEDQEFTDNLYSIYGEKNSIGNLKSTAFPATDPNSMHIDLMPVNLHADLTLATAATITQLRMAFQLQKWYEKAARGGRRYREALLAHFGVKSSDARMMIPEYLGGSRCTISVNQVVQTSESGSTPQGTTAAYSQTNQTSSDVHKSFEEHGYLIGVMVARYDHTYQNGLEKMWTREDMTDFYWPEFSSVGDAPVYNQEIFAQGTSDDKEVFGYQERYAEYRYKPNRVSGEMRSSASNSLDVWHLADDYASLPSLSDTWIREDKTNVDRILAVQSSVSNQLFGDFYIRNICTRPMPTHSIPGMIDHM